MVEHFKWGLVFLVFRLALAGSGKGARSCDKRRPVLVVGMGNSPRKGSAAKVLRGLAEHFPAETKAVVEQVLEMCGQNRTEAARMMGVSRVTFYAVAKDLGIELEPVASSTNATRVDIILVLNKTRGNRAAAARALGISERAMAKLLKRHKLANIIPPRHDDYWKTES